MPLLLENKENDQILKSIEYTRKLEGTNYKNSYTSRLTIECAKDTLSDPSLLFPETMNEFHIEIVEVEAVGHFWAQIREEKYIKQLDDIHNKLKYYCHNFKTIDPSQIYVGQMIVTLFCSSDTYEFTFYRGKITEIYPQSKSAKVSVYLLICF